MIHSIELDILLNTASGPWRVGAACWPRSQSAGQSMRGGSTAAPQSPQAKLTGVSTR